MLDTSGTEEYEHLNQWSVSHARHYVARAGRCQSSLVQEGGMYMTDEPEMIALLESDIAERLRPVCSTMPDAEFAKLVHDIAAVKMKYGADTDLSRSLRSRLHANLSSDGNSPSSLTSA